MLWIMVLILLRPSCTNKFSMCAQHLTWNRLPWRTMINSPLYFSSKSRYKKHYQWTPKKHYLQSLMPSSTWILHQLHQSHAKYFYKAQNPLMKFSPRINEMASYKHIYSTTSWLDFHIYVVKLILATLFNFAFNTFFSTSYIAKQSLLTVLQLTLWKSEFTY